jgi:hypothetical protein
MDYPRGYVAPIRQAIWRTPTIWGVPHLWMMSWVFVCLNLLVWGFFAYGWWWDGAVLVGWGLGHLGIRWAFRCDPHIDRVLWAQVTRRYKRYYEAGGGVSLWSQT